MGKKLKPLMKILKVGTTEGHTALLKAVKGRLLPMVCFPLTIFDIFDYLMAIIDLWAMV